MIAPRSGFNGCVSGFVEAPDLTIRDRLIEAADVELAEFGTLTGRFEAVAHRAGVSRATAYRQLGSVSELMTQVGLRRAKRYLFGLSEAMDRETGTLAKLAAALVFGAQVLPGEPIVLRLVARQFSAVVDPEIYAMINDRIRPIVSNGQRLHEIRSDIEVDSIIGYLVEQSYFATHAVDRSERAVLERFRLFIEPAMAPRAEDRRS